MGQNHIRMINAEPRTSLVAIADPAPQAQTLADANDVPLFADVEAMLDQLVAPIVYRILYGLQPDVAFGRKLVEQLKPARL